MWVVRELVRLVVRIVVAAAVAAALAGILALVSAGSFHSSARILFIAIGCGLLAMAGVGSGSNIERYMDTSVQQAASTPCDPILRTRRSHPAPRSSAAASC